MCKKLFPITLALILALTSIVPAFATEEPTAAESPTQIEQVDSEKSTENEDQNTTGGTEASADNEEQGTVSGTETPTDNEDPNPADGSEAEEPVKAAPTARLKSSEYSSTMSWVDLIITDSNGIIICPAYYTVKAPKITGVGVYTAVIKFKGRYADYEPLTQTFTISPKAPRLNPVYVNKTSVRIATTANLNPNICDKIVYKIYTNDKLEKTVSRKLPKNKTYFDNTIKGLKRNTDYTIKAVYKKGNLSSAVSSVDVHTTATPPTTAISGETAKRFITELKKNKSFTFTFDKPLNISDAYRWENTITQGMIQYNKYEADVIVKNRVVVAMKMKYDKSMAKRANKIAPKINSIINGAKKKNGTRAKVIYVNSRLCKMCKYDYATYKNTKGATWNAYTAYGCLVRGKAVCMGYSLAFDSIMYQLGIPSKCVTTNNHMWNKVKIGKSWYHVDVTWNDCTHSSKYLLKKTHR